MMEGFNQERPIILEMGLLRLLIFNIQTRITNFNMCANFLGSFYKNNRSNYYGSCGDNSGLVLPPRIAPTQVMIIPIAQHKEGVLDKASEIKKRLSSFS